jgi:hypothetical protein
MAALGVQQLRLPAQKDVAISFSSSSGVSVPSRVALAAPGRKTKYIGSSRVSGNTRRLASSAVETPTLALSVPQVLSGYPAREREREREREITTLDFLKFSSNYSSQFHFADIDSHRLFI